MRHTSGITYASSQLLNKKAYVEAGVMKATSPTPNSPTASPNSRWPTSRHHLGLQPLHDILGRFIEVVSGKSLYEFERERLLDPLA